jgi:predicted outer membrane repeat protein
MKNLITCLVVGMLCTTAPADNLVGTPSFESEGGPPSGHTWSVGPGSPIGEWLVTGDGVDYLGSGGSSNPGTPYGNQLVRLRSNYWKYDGSGGVTQSIEVSPGSAYLLSVWARGWTMTIPITLKGNDEEMQFGTTMEWAKYEVLLHPTVSPLNISIESEDSGANIIYAGPYIDNVELLLIEPNVLTVDDDGKADFNSIQDAINAANDGDTVLVYPGIYSGNINTQGLAIQLVSSKLHEAIIDGGANNRGITCTSDETAETVISGFLIKDCHVQDDGGGILLLDSSPTISNCRFVNNAASRGGAVYAEASSSVWTDCEFDGNGAGDGGAVYLTNASQVTMEGCSFINNSCGADGGAIRVKDGSSLTLLDNCTFVNNVADVKHDEARGGAIQVQDGSTLYADTCSFTGNQSGRFGGAIEASGNGELVTLLNCVFENNNADLGGGISCRDATVDIDFCRFENNNAVDGGAIRFADGGVEATIDNCVFSGNYGSNTGAIHLYQDTAPTTITDCGFISNSGGNGGGLSIWDDSNPIVTRCQFIGNEVTGRGGGIFLRSSSPVLNECMFIQNKSLNSSGGGMFVEGESGDQGPELYECEFNNNWALYSGGGYCSTNGEGLLRDCIFDENTSGDASYGEGGGGGIRIESGTVEITECVFSNNADYPGGEGGGAIHFSESNPTLTDCTFTNNTANGSGALRLDSNSNAIITNCAFNSNSAGTSDHGGAIYAHNSEAAFLNCTFSDNLANLGGAIITFAKPVYIDSCFFGNNTASSGGALFLNENYAYVSNTEFCNNNPDDWDDSVGDEFIDEGGNTFDVACDCPDINGDGIIDPNDIMAIIWAWGTCNGCSEDLNDDGVVNLNDLMIVIDSWGMECL